MIPSSLSNKTLVKKTHKQYKPLHMNNLRAFLLVYLKKIAANNVVGAKFNKVYKNKFLPLLGQSLKVAKISKILK